MPGGATLTCARDGTPTQLTCAQCSAPICPQSLVRTAVGMRCPACVGARSTSVASWQRPLLIGGLVVVALVFFVVVRSFSGGSGGARTAPTADAPQRIDRPDLGF